MIINKFIWKFKVEKTSEVLLYNPLRKTMDMTSAGTMAAIEKQTAELAPDLEEYLLERGYIYKLQKDFDDDVVLARAEFQKRESDATLRFVIIPTYDCNARCGYCFLKGQIGKHEIISDTAIDKAFSAMDKIDADRGSGRYKQLSVFGGEPLMDRPPQRHAVERILASALERGYEVDFVTNGHDLAHWCELLVQYRVNKVQVTFDGPEDYHNFRRRTVDGKGSSFMRVAAGIDAALAHGININARLHLDRENVHRLPELVTFFSTRGWTSDKGFSTHVGSIFDCFRCMPDKEKRRHLSIDEGNSQLSEVLTENKETNDLLKVDWHGVRRFLATGEFMSAAFRTCYGGVRTFAFDLNGGVYVCETTAGKPEYKIGDYLPELRFNSSFDKLQNREAMTIDRCRECSEALMCGGGCAFNSYVTNGVLDGPGCRKMRKTVEYGLNHYWNEFEQMTEGGCASGAANACCGSAQPPDKKTFPLIRKPSCTPFTT